nr:Pnap_2097 family protein [Pseudenhygromyxa sp. WMMC2535]
MPQLLIGGLSERWLFKECGAQHWRMLCEDLGVVSSAVVDGEGERLYSTFLRVRFESSGLLAFAENDHVTLEGALSRFRDKRFFSSQTLRGPREQAVARVDMATVFVSRSSNNKSLSRATPEAIARSRALEYRVTPPFSAGYRKLKVAAFEPSQPSAAPGVTLLGYSFPAPGELARLDYAVCPYTDLNGVGLLYFASYPRISDICERRFMTSLGVDADWALVSTPVARDVFYYGNVDSGDLVHYRLRSLSVALDADRNTSGYGGGGVVRLWSTLTRADDSPIADLFTVKRIHGQAERIYERLAAAGVGGQEGAP